MNLMLSLTEVKKYYIHMYEQIRNYIWDFNTVQSLAELEISLFRRFPLLSEVRANFNQLYLHIKRICNEDEDLAKSVEDFRDVINSTDDFYSMIVQPKEV